jgi:hypothetical protein
VLKEYYRNIATYLTDTFGANFIFLIVVLTTTASIAYFVVITYFITQLDKQYFVRRKTSEEGLINHLHLTSMNRSVACAVKIAKIILGIGLLVCGILMLVLPGQGLITILIGLSLIPFPGKDKMEQRILSRHSVRSTLNWIRVKAKKEPFIFD